MTVREGLVADQSLVDNELHLDYTDSHRIVQFIQKERFLNVSSFNAFWVFDFHPVWRGFSSMAGRRRRSSLPVLDFGLGWFLGWSPAGRPHWMDLCQHWSFAPWYGNAFECNILIHRSLAQSGRPIPKKLNGKIIQQPFIGKDLP